MAARFQPKTLPGGRLTPSALGGSTISNTTLTPVSPSTYVPGETDQNYLGKMRF